MKAILACVAVTMLMGYEPAASVAPVHQTQYQFFFSNEEKFLNGVMIRAYNGGDAASLKELLQYWQDVNGTTAP
jgi:hypothetical protein